MSAVPASLKPFVKALEPFEPHVATALGKWLPRLALLVGSVAHVAESGGDPDGYEGVARRGPYERLLLSEWATALEMPDEFLRRAAMHEHLFVELMRRQPRGSLQSLLVVDTGPDQLGSPRLVHLAIALVAEARARRAKAAFAWGATTEPARLFPVVDVESVRHVLGARRATPLGDAAMARWHMAVAHFEGTVDVLFVGGAHFERVVARSPFAGASATRFLRVDAAISGDAVDVAVGGARPARSLRLPLPDEATCIRALRDPFERDAVRGPPSSIPVLDVVADAGLCIPIGGRRVLVRTLQGVIALAEPNSPRAGLGLPKHLALEAGDVVVAAGLVGKRPIALVRAVGGSLTAVFAQARTIVDGDIVLDVADVDTMRLLSAVVFDALLDADVLAVPRAGTEVPRPIPELDFAIRGFVDGPRGYALLPHVRRLVELPEDNLIAPIALRGTSLSVRSKNGGVVIATHTGKHIVEGEFMRGMLGSLRSTGGFAPGALALERRDGSFMLLEARHSFAGGDDVNHTSRFILEPPPGEVLGSAYHPAHGPCLVLREDDRRLIFAGKSAIERHAFALPIIAVAPNLELPQIAVLTADGTVTLLFTKTGARAVLCKGRASSPATSTASTTSAALAVTPVMGTPRPTQRMPR